jgi:hypothetical protein
LFSKNPIPCREINLLTEKQWCRRGDLNPHRTYIPLDPESSASANSATSASWIRSIENDNTLFYIFLL